MRTIQLKPTERRALEHLDQARCGHHPKPPPNACAYLISGSLAGSDGVETNATHTIATNICEVGRPPAVKPEKLHELGTAPDERCRSLEKSLFDSVRLDGRNRTLDIAPSLLGSQTTKHPGLTEPG